MTGGQLIGAGDRRLWPMLAGIALIGLTLRIAAAQGDYWLDEAWSALFARDARTPGGVFFAINHDNNHYLNTLWLQLAGWGSPPIFGRALSILCGTAGIVVAGLIGARRSLPAAWITALLFAVSPILVTYGSEARGYAPMLLALLAATWIIDRDLHGLPLRNAPILLGLVALIGMLAHASMLVGIAALIGWTAIEHRRRMAWRPAAMATLALAGRMIAAVMAVLLLFLVGAMAGRDGFRMGIAIGFDGPAFADALAYMLAFTLGWPLAPDLWLLPILLMPLLIWRTPTFQDRAPFLLIAILGWPLIVMTLQPANSAIPRYYLLSAVALLLLLADLLAVAKPWFRYGALTLLLAGGITMDIALIANRRGDPGRAVDMIAMRAPKGAVALID
ncbi:MAG: hypothetical protein ABW128_10980, partial [Rhizorhabdus sp.]